MNYKPLNIFDNIVSIKITCSMNFNVTVLWNGRSLAVKPLESRQGFPVYAYSTQNVKVDSLKTKIEFTFISDDDGTVHFEIIKNNNVAFRSPFYFLPEKGSHKHTIGFETKSRFSQRTKAETLMRQFSPYSLDRELELEELNLHYNDGSAVTLTGENFSIPVFYATDRNAILNEHDLINTYGGSRSDLKYGIGTVNIPKNKRKGELPRPEWFVVKWRENPSKHVTILNLYSLEADVFFQKLKENLNNCDSSDVLLFIHGFNESFNSAMMRAAQIAYDINFTGVTSVFSWPSANSLTHYVADMDAAKFSIKHLLEFLIQLKEYTETRKVHIIAHSMGNEPVTQALLKLKSDDFFESYRYNHLIMAAPDIDEEIFARDTVDDIVKSVSRVTIYTNEKDRALWASKFLRGNQARLGEFSGSYFMKDVDLIDATSESTGFLGHGYFSQTKPLLDDIRKTIILGYSPEQRNLSKEEDKVVEYWKFNND